MAAVSCILISISDAHAQATKPGASETAAVTPAELERRIKMLEFQVRGLQGRVAYKYASLDCNTGKYDEFQFDSGSLVFFAACSKIEPYLEGHKITVSIGNPYTFTFSNVKGLLNYGKDWADSLQKKVDVSMTETLRGGAWNTIVITVNPSKPEEMRYLGLGTVCTKHRQLCSTQFEAKS
jgi:hypothetical protein